jgi:hypothetical protein
MHTYKLRTIPSNSDIPESRISFDQLIVIKVGKTPKQVLLLQSDSFKLENIFDYEMVKLKLSVKYIV